MAIDVGRGIDELYALVRLCRPRYGGDAFFPQMNALFSRILHEGSMADFQIFFDRVILPASENGAAADPVLIDWREACRDFAYYMDGDNYRAIVDGGWIPRFEKTHVEWFFRALLLYDRQGREELVDRIVTDRWIAAETRALFCHAVFKAKVSLWRHGREFIDLPRFWYCNRSTCARIADTKNCVQHKAIKKISVPRNGKFHWSATMVVGVVRDNFAVFELNREIEDRKITDAMLEALIRSDAVGCFTGLLSHHPEEVFELRTPEEWLLTVCRCAKEDFAVAAVNELERLFPGLVVRTRDPWGNTPLWNTFVNSNPTEKLQKELIRLGCDPDVQNEWGLTYRLVRDNTPEKMRKKRKCALM